jgi:uncharacterized protein (TIGR03000 family)
MIVPEQAPAQYRGGHGGRGYGSGGYGSGRGLYGYGRGFYGYPYDGGFSLGLGLGYGLTYSPFGSPSYGSYFGFPYSGGYSPYVPAYSGSFYAPDRRFSAAASQYFNGVGFASSDGSGQGMTQSFYAGPVPSEATAARIRVLVPAEDAQVFFDGTLTKQQGTDREFMTPPLLTGRESHYTISASWTENGQRVSRERRIAVSPGVRVEVDFRPPSTNP